MNLTRCLSSGSKKPLTITVTRTVAVLSLVVLFEFLVICVLFYNCRMEQEKSRIYGDIMGKSVLVPKSTVLPPSTLHHK